MKLTGKDLESVRKVIDKEGIFITGPYVGLTITSVINAMNDSAWDYPSAMNIITGILGLTKRCWPMRSTKSEIYAVLKEICPDVMDWDEAPSVWGTDSRKHKGMNDDR